MIAEFLDVSKPMITAHITVLEKKGYIYKEYSKTKEHTELKSAFQLIGAMDATMCNLLFLQKIRKE